MVAVRTVDGEAIDDRSNEREPLMRWICLRNVPRDVKLMFRRAFVDEIAIIDFHGDVTVGPPFVPKRT